MMMTPSIWVDKGITASGLWGKSKQRDGVQGWTDLNFFVKERWRVDADDDDDDDDDDDYDDDYDDDNDDDDDDDGDDDDDDDDAEEEEEEEEVEDNDEDSANKATAPKVARIWISL